ncbi:MAG TPA: SDR family NAD(P)-dependent oxidoreductase [Sphingomonas sp.]|nr:SDR family NAD(P)-dependent oxidoreductase [Sphingomonas sp.]
MPRLILFGPGFSGTRIAAALERDGWEVVAIGRDAPPIVTLEALAKATHLISTVPPGADGDPVLAAHGETIGRIGWIGYLSSTGVYGDTRGAWIDESAVLAGRRGGRVAADLAWQAIGARVFRLPGIYGPGRSMIERLRAGQAHRVDLPGQVFCRIHVDDIVRAVLAAIQRGPAGIYNVADDLPAAQNDVVAYGARLLGIAMPPLTSLDDLNLSPAARAFYSENRRVSNAKAKRVLGWRPIHSTYREGLTALI